MTNKSPECGVTGHSTVTKSFKTIIYQFTQQPFENAKILSLHHFFQYCGHYPIIRCTNSFKIL